MNHRENGWFIKNCASSTAIYANWGQGSHGKMDQAIATIHKIIQIIQQAMSIYIVYYN